MAKLIVSDSDICKLIHDSGAPANLADIVTFTAIVLAESGGNAYAVGVNGNPNRPSYRSLDVGLFQINTYWHPQYSIANLLDPLANTLAARTLSGGWATFAPWNAWHNGAFNAFVPRAYAAAQGLGYVI